MFYVRILTNEGARSVREFGSEDAARAYALANSKRLDVAGVNWGKAECPICGSDQNLETDKRVGDYACELCEHTWRV